MIDFHSMPVTEETVAKLHGLILALAMRSETHDVSAAKIIEEIENLPPELQELLAR